MITTYGLKRWSNPMKIEEWKIRKTFDRIIVVCFAMSFWEWAIKDFSFIQWQKKKWSELRVKKKKWSKTLHLTTWNISNSILIEHQTIKMDIIRQYLLLNSTTMKLSLKIRLVNGPKTYTPLKYITAIYSWWQEWLFYFRLQNTRALEFGNK